MKPKTVWIIGAILFCLIVHNPIVTLLALAAGLAPVACKVLELGACADDPDYRSKHQ